MRLLFELPGIEEREMAKLREEAAKQGYSSFAAEFFLNTSQASSLQNCCIRVLEKCPTIAAITHLCGHTFLVNQARWNGKCPTCRKLEKARKD